MKKNPASIDENANASAQQARADSAKATGKIFHSKQPATENNKGKTMNAYKNENGQLRTPAEIAEIKKASKRIGRPWQTIASRPLYAAQVIAEYRRLSRFDRKPFTVFGK